MATEKTLQASIVKLFAQHEILVLKFTSPAHRGVPDLVCMANGVTIWIEVKHPNGKGRLSALQEIMIEQMRAKGAHVYVVDSIEQARAIARERFNL
jgi:Holliday junction resolvase